MSPLDIFSYYGGIFFILTSILAFFTSKFTIDSMLAKISEDKHDVRDKVSFNGLYKLFYRVEQLERSEIKQNIAGV